MSNTDIKVSLENSDQDKDKASHTSSTALHEKRKPDNLTETTAATTAEPNQNNALPPSPKRRRLNSSETKHESDTEDPADIALVNALHAEAQRTKIVNASQPAQPAQPAQQNGHIQVTPSQNPPTESPLVIRKSRIDGLPHLNMVTQELLNCLAALNSVEIGEMLFGPPSLPGHEYRVIKARFEKAKEKYQIIPPFLSPHALGMLESRQVDIIRKVNIATFMASIFSGELGMRVMDMSFIDIFVPDGGRLLKAQASIYLELKTQAFVAAARTAPQMLNQVMLDLFPNNTTFMLLQKRPNAKILTPTEQDFINRLNSRRDILWALIRNNQLQNVHETYSWKDFSREVSTYLTKYVESLKSGDKAWSDASSPEATPSTLPKGQIENQIPPEQAPLNIQNTEAPLVATGMASLDDDDDDWKALIRQVFDETVREMRSNPKYGLPPLSPVQQPGQITTVVAKPAESRITTEQQESSERSSQGRNEFQHYDPAQGATSHDEKEVPHSSQTAPTQVLYERARQVNKSSPSNKKNIPPSHRRPWTTEEENALMTGLDNVRGPHWSQILAMYGPGGTVNESLKDRNQVQLKDKARNLKLFFLKAGIEVPYYLQAVTGDLKSRAPGQAEKMGRDKLSGDDDQNSGDEVQDEAESTEQGPDEEDRLENTAGNPQVSQSETRAQVTASTANCQSVEEDLESMPATAAVKDHADLKSFE